MTKYFCSLKKKKKKKGRKKKQGLKKIEVHFVNRWRELDKWAFWGVGVLLQTKVGAEIFYYTHFKAQNKISFFFTIPRTYSMFTHRWRGW